jgi:uncharacterized protein (TIGR02117 family)
MTQTKTFLRVVINVLRISILLLISGVVLYFVVATGFSFLPTHPPKQNCSADNEIFITTNGIHLDLILRIDQMNPDFIDQLNPLPGSRFVAFGWGDKNFYINTPEWSDLTLPVAFKALFLRSETAMHVTFHKQTYLGWETLELCNHQLDTLTRYIEKSFQRNQDGELMKLDFEGYSHNDSFFKARGTFTLFRTCNVWVNNALKKINVKTSVWSPFDWGVLYHVKRQ